MSYVHPVVSALGTLDRSLDNYQERRVKIINKYTHTIDPVIEVDSEDEEDSDDEHNLEEMGSGMGALLSELVREQPTATPSGGGGGGGGRALPGPKLAHDIPTLMLALAEAQGVLKGARQRGPIHSDEEKALIAAVQAGDVQEVQRLLAVPGRASLELAGGDTLLHLACRTPVDRVIALIARTKPDLNAVNRKGRAPLHELALHGGTLVILGSLVKLGADPFMRDHLGKDPVSYIAADNVRESFEKWLATHNYHPPNSEVKQAMVDIPIFTKSGKRCITHVTSETTVDQLLSDLPPELAALRGSHEHLTLIEYRRKVGDDNAKLSLLQGTQRVLELAATWREDPCGSNPLYRFLLVPNSKHAPREVLEAYERGGFGNVVKK